jgi:hypothetical protein
LTNINFASVDEEHDVIEGMKAMHKGYAQSPSTLKQRTLLVFLAFAAMAVVLLWQDHR